MTRLPAFVLLALTLLIGCGSDKTEPPDTAAQESPDPTTTPAPDLGGRLLFSRFDESTHTFISTHVSRSDGSGEVELPLPGPEGGGVWSRSGEHIAVMTLLPDDRIGTAIITPEGDVERVLEIPDPTLNLVCVNWSPDDQRLMCEGFDDKDPARNGVYTVRASDGHALVRVTSTPEGATDQPGDYAPDGKSLVFMRGPSYDSGNLMLVPVDGGKPAELYDGTVEDAGRFSPDGATVLTAGGGRLLMLDLEGNVQHEISREDHYLFGAVWSPDGSHIAYSDALEGPHADVYTATADGSERYQVTSTPDNEIVVEWGAEQP